MNNIWDIFLTGFGEFGIDLKNKISYQYNTNTGCRHNLEFVKASEKSLLPSPDRAVNK
jgi:hypothetical protein